MTLIVDMNRRGSRLAYSEFVKPIMRVAGDCDVAHYSEVEDETLRGHERAILSGTPLMDCGYQDEIGKFGWLSSCEMPVLGICAGMQAIALRFGGRVVPSQEIGMTLISTVRENPLFRGDFKAYSLHNLAVEPSGSFEILAKSDKCVQAMAHREKMIFGLLFHPEVRNPDILEKFMDVKPRTG